MRHVAPYRQRNPRKGNLSLVVAIIFLLFQNALSAQALIQIGSQAPYQIQQLQEPFGILNKVDSFKVLSATRLAVRLQNEPGFWLYSVNLQRLSNIPVEEIRPGNEGIFTFRFGGKWGIADSNGKVLVKPRFEDAGVYAEGKVALREGSCWGFAGKNGKWLLKPRFNCEIEGYAPFFSCGRALVYDPGAGGWKYITPEGKYISQRAYPNAFPFKYNHAWIQEDDGFYLINLSAEIRLGPFTDIVPDPGSPLVPYFKNDKFGFANVKSGKLLTDARFYEVSGHHRGAAAVLSDQGWTILDSLGQTCRHDFFESLEFGDGEVFIYSSGEPTDRWFGLVKPGCEIEVPAVWKTISAFHQGVAIASRDGNRFELINLRGENILGNQYFDRCSYPAGGFVLVRQNGFQEVISLAQRKAIQQLNFKDSQTVRLIELR